METQCFQHPYQLQRDSLCGGIQKDSLCGGIQRDSFCGGIQRDSFCGGIQKKAQHCLKTRSIITAATVIVIVVVAYCISENTEATKQPLT